MSIGFNEEFDIRFLQRRLREMSDEKLSNLAGRKVYAFTGRKLGAAGREDYRGLSSG